MVNTAKISIEDRLESEDGAMASASRAYSNLRLVRGILDRDPIEHALKVLTVCLEFEARHDRPSLVPMPTWQYAIEHMVHHSSSLNCWHADK